MPALTMHGTTAHQTYLLGHSSRQLTIRRGWRARQRATHATLMTRMQCGMCVTVCMQLQYANPAHSKKSISLIQVQFNYVGAAMPK